MTIFLFGILLKSIVLAIWALLYGLIFRRPYILNSNLLKYLAASLFVIIGYSACYDADFFTLLLFLIYIGAVMIIFLLAYLIVPLDSSILGTTALVETWKARPTHTFALHIAFFNFTLLFIDRLIEAKIYIIDQASPEAPIVGERVSLDHSSWLLTEQLAKQTESQIHLERVASPTALAVELCTTYPIGLTCIMVSLFVVLFGILGWVRNSYRTRI